MYMDNAPSPHVTCMAHGLVDCVRRCTMSPYSSFVVEKFIEILHPASIQFLIDEIMVQHERVLRTAKHASGCRILKQLLEHCRTVQTDPIVDVLSPHAAGLSIHRHGNYVLQHNL